MRTCLLYEKSPLFVTCIVAPQLMASKYPPHLFVPACNRGTLQDITNKNRHCMKSPTPETQCAEGIFQTQYLVCALNFINKISRSSWTWQNLWKLLTIHFRNIYFHNSVDWSGLYLQVYIPSWFAKILILTVFRLLENALVKLPCPYHDLIINPPCRTVLQ